MASRESNFVGVLFPLWSTLASLRCIAYHSPLRFNQFAPTRNNVLFRWCYVGDRVNIDMFMHSFQNVTCFVDKNVLLVTPLLVPV